MSTFAKILLYSLSLVPLYFLFMVKKFDTDSFEKVFNNYKNIDCYKAFMYDNLIPLFFLVVIVISYVTYRKLTSELNSRENLPKQFSNIKNIDFNHLTFIATYIIPLLAFQLDTIKDIIFLIFLLSFIGVIYIKTNLYYLNPIFILYGIRIFSAVDKNGNESILMTKEGKLLSTETLHYTMLGDIYFVEKG